MRQSNNTHRPAVFLDKDGTLVEDIPWCYDTRRVRFYPGVFEGLRLLHRSGYALVVVTNQSGVALGYGTEHDVKHMESMIQRAAQAALNRKNPPNLKAA